MALLTDIVDGSVANLNAFAIPYTEFSNWGE